MSLVPLTFTSSLTNTTTTILPSLSCQASATSHGVFSQLLGSLHLSLRQTTNTSIALDVYSSAFSSVRTHAVKCEYDDCELLSSVECSSYVSGYANCWRCSVSKCEVQVNDFLHLFKENDNDKNSTDFAYRSFTGAEEKTSIEVDEGISYYDTTPSFSSLPFLFPFSSSSSHPTLFACHKEGDCVWLQVGKARREEE